MSVYSDTSKMLGFDHRDVAIPSIDRANELARNAVNGDIHAYRELFKIVRFAPTPTTTADRHALDIVCSGFAGSKKLFS